MGAPLPNSRRAEHTMGMPQVAHVWTPDEVRALPDDGRRYEVVAGELLVTPAPSFRHQEAVLRLARTLSDYTERTGVGYTLLSPADIEPEPGALVQPDVFVGPLPQGRRPSELGRLRPPAPGHRGPLAINCAGRSHREAIAVSARRGAGILDRRLGRSAGRAVVARRRPPRSPHGSAALAPGSRYSSARDRPAAVLWTSPRRLILGPRVVSLLGSLL